MNNNELKDRFMRDNAEFLMKEFSQVLKGELDSFTSQSQYVLDKGFEIIFDGIKSATEIDETLAQSSSGVIKMMARGDISAKEAQELLCLLEKLSQIEETQLGVKFKRADIEMKQTMADNMKVLLGGKK